MAQAKRGIRVRTHGLGRRFGLSGRAWVALACAVAVVVIATMAGLRLAHGDDFSVERGEMAATSATAPADVSESEAKPIVMVHVDGAVANPGVYELTGEDVRVNDAVLAAGGLVEGADTSSLNLAAPLEDGSKVHVPTVSETSDAAATTGAATAATTNGNGTATATPTQSPGFGALVALVGLGAVAVLVLRRN